MKSTFLYVLLPTLAFSQIDPIKREIDFVTSQKQTLEKQLSQVKSQRGKENSELNKQLDLLHKEKARLAAELELTENEVAEFSRLAKKQLHSQSTLNDRHSWMKSKNEELEYFLPQKDSTTDENLTMTLKRHGAVLESISQIFTAEKSYLDGNQSLTQGNVFHLGPFARFLEAGDQWKVLALNDSGYYTETGETSFSQSAGRSPFIAAAFIQLPFQKIQPILKEKNMFNRILDLIPGLFLALVFFAIGWIFVQLAKS
ncbi:MAG: hypothetical protein JNL11_10410 [Bdellovibrionaceae bacterium]|nr:hypothetical protein [Pseudobdellovibrionaceae bacterium]